MNTNKIIGEQLKKYRELKSYSLNDVAELVGKSKSAIHSYEVGRVSIAVDTLEELCNVYGIDYLSLLETVQRKKNK